MLRKGQQNARAAEGPPEGTRHRRGAGFQNLQDSPGRNSDLSKSLSWETEPGGG